MKAYRLKKELPDVDAGTPLQYQRIWNGYGCKRNVQGWVYIFPVNTVETNKEWFEEYEA